MGSEGHSVVWHCHALFPNLVLHLPQNGVLFTYFRGSAGYRFGRENVLTFLFHTWKSYVIFHFFVAVHAMFFIPRFLRSWLFFTAPKIQIHAYFTSPFSEFLRMVCSMISRLISRASLEWTSKLFCPLMFSSGWSRQRPQIGLLNLYLPLTVRRSGSINFRYNRCSLPLRGVACGFLKSQTNGKGLLWKENRLSL
jgi:hypothetical protein